MTVKAVIFDFDGLIVDTETPAYQAWSKIYADYGVSLQLNIWVQCVGSSHSSFDPVRHLESLTGKAFDRGRLFALKEELKSEICRTQGLLPGVLDRLTEAKSLGLPLAVASSSERSWVQGHSERLNIASFFSVWRTKEDVRLTKPNPELYLSAATGLGVKPEDCMVFEDSLNGVKAAKAAGAYCIAVPNPVTEGLDFSLADQRIKSLSEINLADFIASR